MSILDINDTINNYEIGIKQFMGDNYDIYGTYIIEENEIVDVNDDVYVKNGYIKSLTNGLF